VKNQTSLDAEALSLVREAGYHDLTSFQRKVVSLIAKGKDTVVEVSYQKGKTVAFILPLLLRLKKNGSGIKAIVLASKTEDLTKILNEFKRFQLQGSRTGQKNSVRVKSHSENRGLLTVLLSEENEIRAEVRSFSREPDIIISSPGRLIDHIRRGNVYFSDELRVVINVREIEPGLLEDLQFIYSKLPPKKQTIIFSPAQESENLESWSILRRPRVFKEVESNRRLRRADHFYLEVEDERKKTVLLDLISSQKLASLIVICEKDNTATALAQFLIRNKLRARRVELASSVEEPNLEADIVVLTDNSLGSRVFPEIKVIINFDPPGDAEIYRRRCSYLIEGPSEIFTFVGKDQYFNLNQIQEMLKVRVQNQAEPTEEDIIKGSIERILQIIKEQEDPDELNHFRRIVKKHVPIFLRSYFMAYLFKQSMGTHEARPDRFTTLFISVGKNRRVYPRDLVSLFMSNLKISRSDIGAIKVFDNYSFVDVSLDHASDAISTLSGSNFRGRRIAVNRARKRNDSKG